MKRPFKYTLYLLTAFMLMIGLTACGGVDSGYQKLGSEAEILNALENTMSHNESRCLFYVDSEELIDANKWLNALPGIKNINCEYRRSGSGYNVTVSLTYWDNYPIVYAYKNNDTSILTEKQKELLEEYIRVLDVIDGRVAETDSKENASGTESEPATESKAETNKTLTTEERILKIHDYMVENISYDSSLDYIFNAYDALIGHRAICGGYAEVFKTFMDMIGVECITVSGTAGGENHMWNMIQLDGEWYHVDVTWDDPVGNSDGSIYHVYFNIDDSAMEVDHQWDRDKYPDASGTKYSYYNIMGIKLLNSQKELDAYVAELVKNHERKAEILVYGESDIKEAFGKLSGRIFSYSYSKTDRKAYTIYSVTMKY